MIDPLFSRVLAVAFALMWMLAAWHKLSAREEFGAALGEYRLLPPALLPLAAVLVPACEVLLGIAWLAAPPAGPAVLTAALLLLYAAAIAINLLRGRVHIGCGCGFGGTGKDLPLSWWLVGRNLLLAGLALAAAWPARERPLGAYDGLTLFLALAAGAVLFAGASQLLRNGAAMAVWRTPRD